MAAGPCPCLAGCCYQLSYHCNPTASYNATQSAGRDLTEPLSEADDGSRTRYLELGKLALYQVSYVRRKP